MAEKKAREKHMRPTAAQMDERINIEVEGDDAEAVIEAFLKVDPDSPVHDRED